MNPSWDLCNRALQLQKLDQWVMPIRDDKYAIDCSTEPDQTLDAQDNFGASDKTRLIFSSLADPGDNIGRCRRPGLGGRGNEPIFKGRNASVHPSGDCINFLAHVISLSRLVSACRVCSFFVSSCLWRML